jgi:dihydrofolate reductase
MPKVTAHISMSIDGCIAGPNGGPGNPLGDGGTSIQDWMFDLASFVEAQGGDGGVKDEDDAVLRERFVPSGAVVMGRRMFDEGEEPWGDEPPFHAPVFVATHRDREPLQRAGGTSFTFVTGGLEEALDQARQAAGNRNVNIAGGAQIVRDAIVANLLDELELHVVPLLFGDGVRLFDTLPRRPAPIQIDRVVATSRATHIRYQLATTPPRDSVLRDDN